MLRRLRNELKAVLLCTAIGMVCVPQMASAALGGAEVDVADDAQRLGVALKSTDRENYRVHTLQLASGTVLREYALVGGNVFAVAWSGPSLPDLRQSLGRYFDSYVSGAQAHPGSHHHLEIRQSDLVVQSSGRMRSFTGRAYLPQGVPAGVSLDELH